MNHIENVIKLTDGKVVNLYQAIYIDENRNKSICHIASRKECVADLAIKNIDEVKADAVIVVPIFENNDLIFTKSFMKAINREVYTFPAGKIGESETIENAILNVVNNKIGLRIVDICELSKPRFISTGISDEVITIYMVRVKGEIPEDKSNCKIVELNELFDFIHDEENIIPMTTALASMYMGLETSI